MIGAPPSSAGGVQYAVIASVATSLTISPVGASGTVAAGAMNVMTTCPSPPAPGVATPPALAALPKTVPAGP